jgi:putative transposase
MRLVEFAVLGTHLHLVIEAETSDALSRGMQGLCVRLARSLNRLLQRRGSLFNDHYHSHLLKTPAEVAYALRYVLDNAEKHYGVGPGRRDLRSILVDCCTSSSPELRELLFLPRGWLLSIGWKRARCPFPAGYSPGAPSIG